MPSDKYSMKIASLPKVVKAKGIDNNRQKKYQIRARRINKLRNPVHLLTSRKSNAR